MSLLCLQNNRHGVCRLNAETESDTKENAGKLLAHIGRSRVSPLTSLMPQHLQPMLEKAFAVQHGSQLKQVINHCFVMHAAHQQYTANAKVCLLCLAYTDGAARLCHGQLLCMPASTHHLLFAAMASVHWNRPVSYSGHAHCTFMPPIHIVMLIVLHWLECAQSLPVCKPALSSPFDVAMLKGQKVPTKHIVPDAVGAAKVSAHLHQALRT